MSEGPPHETTPPKLAALVPVLAAAFTIVYLETTLFHALVYLGSYFDAILAIAVALLGLSLGSLFAHFRPISSETRILRVLLYATIAAPTAMIVIAVATSVISDFAFLLIPTFGLAAYILGVSFANLRSAWVYAVDLLGAAAGVACAALMIELASMEIALIAAAIPSALAIVAVAARSRRLGWLAIGAAAAGLVVSVAVYQAETDALDFLRIARGQRRSKSRSYSHAQDGRHRILFSESSLAGRIDVLGRGGPTANQPYAQVRVYQDGHLSDTFKFKTVAEHSADPRVPWGFVENPDTLIIGTSAEGVVNAVAGMGDGAIVGLEINPGKVAVMQTPWGKEWTHDAYRHLDELHILDARTYLKLTDRKFDHITLMNAHLGQRKARALAPEFVHTREAFVEYFEHLTDRGLLNLEEIYRQKRLSIHTNRKLVATLRRALLDIGAERPGDHVIIYNWNNYYRQYLVKRTPYTDAERQWFLDWIAAVHQERRRLPFSASIELVFEPKMADDSSVEARLLAGDDVRDRRFRYDLTTDDRPFPFNVFRVPPRYSWLVGSLAAYLLILCGFVYWRMRSQLPARAARIGALAIFVLTGFGYLAIEITLINQLQLFVGSPVVSMIATISAMLLFSSLGSFLTRRVPQRGFAAVCVGAAILGALTVMFGSAVLGWLIGPSLWWRGLAAVLTVAPLATAMGMPFPLALDAIKERGAVSSAPMLFAVNCAASALISPVALLAASQIGLRATALIAAVFYLLAIGAASLMNRAR